MEKDASWERERDPMVRAVVFGRCVMFLRARWLLDGSHSVVCGTFLVHM